MKKYKKVSISTVRANFNKGIAFHGFLVGNKVAPSHFFGGWHLACELDLATMVQFESARTQFQWYLDAELGSAAAIYIFE